MAEKKAKKDDFRKYVKWLWILFLSPALALFLCVLLARVGAFGPLPSTEEIANPKSFLASQIISNDNEILGTFFEENRIHSEYENLPPHLVNALIATEDERFREHSGIDFRALARAVAKMGRNGGGSTLTQQLAKQLFSDNFDNVTLVERIGQKFKEWVISTRLEERYTKDEIIVLYLNQFDFLYDAVGINSAAQTYFNCSPDSLKIHQAAMLVGMVKNPALYNPIRREELTINRRNTVFGQMVRNGFLSQEDADSLSQLPLDLNFNRSSHTRGPAPYFREHVRSYMKDWVETHRKPNGDKYNIYTDGLKIYTTIDSRMQAYAEASVTEHLSNLQRVFVKVDGDRSTFPFYFQNNSTSQIENILASAWHQTPKYKSMKKNGVSDDSINLVYTTPVEMEVFSWDGPLDTIMSPKDSIRYMKSIYQVGMMSIEPQTGFIKVWVGGVDYRYFKYDHVQQGRRQVGSTFKPFVYATAIEQKHYSPCMQVPNVLTCIEAGQYGLMDDWCPKNSGDEYGGVVTLKEGLAHSMNTITTYLMKQTGPVPVIRLARRMGIEAEIPEAPSIALGTVDLSVYEMVGSYTTFANKGRYSEPIFITRIEDKNGVVLQEFLPRQERVMSEEDAYTIVNLMTGVAQAGTGIRLKINGNENTYRNGVVTGFPYRFTNEIAGKTGTTQNQSDGWFMGMVPNLITGVWTGCEDRSAHFSGVYYGQGATTALPIWANFMRRCYNDTELNVSREDFAKPDYPMTIQLDCDQYRRDQNPGFGGGDSDPDDQFN
ncbi:penicillin-binding protein 1A [Phaeocystidibacter luteus]|uniref:Penicillin-binding protein n=1 Tax=Phaeocystidibacter luteus TaxID=911197 RepID=A0A6N6RK62_9FLAO|nr:transglycosylase domain-containing protein [Phaeocystidibacter luteus]KAB2808721.1 penicillin-binding protein [Phaeocystidibacter luteus]